MAKQTKPLDEKALSEELKRLRDIEEREQLLFKSEELIPSRPRDIKEEQLELTNGFVGSINDMMALMRKQPRNLDPMFPYKRVPFFKLLFKLKGWDDKDYTEFIKPPVCGRIIRRFIYRRFPDNVLPTLLELPNPALFRYVKRYKLYQFLTDEGLRLLEGYIWDAIKVMEDSTDWSDFEKKYCTLYNLAVPPRQQNLFEASE